MLFSMLNVLYFYRSILLLLLLLLLLLFCHHLHHGFCYLLTVGAVSVQWSCQRVARDVVLNNNNNNNNNK
jgi:preprotein translocase subunit SecF